MIRKIVLFSFMFLAAIAAHSQAPSSQDEWDQYFNAIFLPEASNESQNAIRSIKNPQLLQLAESGTRKEPERERVASTMSRKATSAEDASAAVVESFSNYAEVAPAYLPQVIERAEKSGDTQNLKMLYPRYETEYPIHPNVYHYGRTALASVSPGGWLLVNGHLDTYPLRVLQIYSQVRPDVTIVNLEWLKNDPSYRRLLEQKLVGQPKWQQGDSDLQLIQKLREVIANKIHLSLTLPHHILRAFSDQSHPVGVVLRLGSDSSMGVKHHEVLSQVDWSRVVNPDPPAYVKALQQNYLAALLIDVKLGQPEKLGNYDRTELLESLYQQRNTKAAAKKYLKSE